MGLLGIATAYAVYMFQPCSRHGSPARFGRFIVALQQVVFRRDLRRHLRPACVPAGANLWRVGDATIIDGMPNGMAALTADSSRQAVKIQTGSIAVYAFVMLIGVVLLVGIFMLFR